eukprot:TRINITY_DN3332_c0_g1_i18.p1 TRINITY_DN3332_c0_g1~~TRINITY_DN3332_c0_g1_i18.p1  ORF type:complete len:182 (+),score=57.64 TRINITY_DN3332_c0_g1_i18:233-778(+)
MSDRLCIKNEGAYLKLSAQDLICKTNVKCEGNFNMTDIFGAVEKGITDDNCIPYEDSSFNCPIKECKNHTKPVLYKCKSVRTIDGEENIKKEVRERGPVMCEFAETKDHDDYYDGVYYKAHSKRKNTFMTAYKVVGYGIENGMKYWIGEQSKGNTFGEAGYVRYRISEELCNKAYICDDIN